MNNFTRIVFWAMFLTVGHLAAQSPGQTLVWEDNFTSATLNTAVWKPEIGDGCDKGICGWGNAELEYYRNENARIESGNLIIEARREAFGGKAFTSARLKTEGLMQFKYGTIEARIKVPSLPNGLWPAFWTLGTVGGNWPAIGEIDMMEMGSGGALSAGLGNKRVGSAAHWSNVAGAYASNNAAIDATVDLSADYHLYKMVWTSQSIKMFLDGVEFYSFDISGGAAAGLSEFHSPHYVLLNLAVGGNYTGILNEANITATLPGQMKVDYVKLYQGAGEELFLASNNPTPLTAAPTPTKPQVDVVSLFSDAYTNKTVDTWSASWDQADVADVQLFGNATKLYTNLNFAGVEFTSAPIDVTAQTHFHMDIWTPNSSTFKIKLVDFGANGIFQGTPNDDKEHELTFTPAIGSWVSYDIKLSDFTGLTTRAHLAQMILVGSTSTVYVDNVYFYTDNKPTAPTVAAPTPTKPAADVISMFSNAYTNVPVGTWSADWDVADVADVKIAGNDTKLYTNLVYAGIDFSSNLIDASAQTHIHMDIWTPNSTLFKIKLVDFGANGVYQGTPNDDKEHELSFTPALGSWVSYDIPLSDFAGLTTRAHLAQLIISGSTSTVYVDNVYFYKGTVVVNAPLTAAPTPTKPAADVISMFSNAYTNVPVGTWSADWDVADVADVKIDGNDTKLYTNLVYAGIDFSSNLIDATAYTHIHMDIWTPNSTLFKIKLVDFGANGVYQGSPNDDKEHELSFTPALGSWVSYDIPLSDFTNLTTRAHLAQLIISGSTSTVYVDNVYFYKGSAVSNVPLTAAPTPTKPAADVISMFSNAYTNVSVGTWSADWDLADVVDVKIVGNDTKLYTNLVFAGIDFSSNLIDASAQTHIHMDIWTPNSTTFKIKLVDFGANGVYQGSPNDDKEHELSFTPALGSWVSYDIPLSDFTNLTTRAHLAQMILVGSTSTVYVDNVYFYKNSAAVVPCTGVAVNGDYSYEVYTSAGTAYFKMHPLSPITGSASAIIYLKEGAGAAYPGYNMTASGGDFTYSKTIANGVSTSFYFSYAVPAGGERNSSANPHTYIVGSTCVAGAPSVVITSPKESASFTQPAKVTINATAADADGTVSKVEFYSGTTLLGMDATSPYSFTWTGVVAGNYALTAKATDNSSLSTTSTVVNIIVNTPNTNGYCETAFNGDYEYKAETIGGVVKFTFHPLTPIAGSTYAIVFIQEGGIGAYPGYNMTAAAGNTFVFTKSIANTTPLSIYFTYQVPSGGERNSTEHPHTYTVGDNCTGIVVETVPKTAAPTPTRPANKVLSMFSNAYTNVPIGTWSADWDLADVTDVQIVGNDTKLYSNLVFAGVDFSSNLINATEQVHLHMDIWTPNSTTFKVKLVDFGANGIYQGTPNDDKEHELSFTPALGSWVSYDIPLSDFTNLTTRGHLAQLILVGSTSTVYMDNVYFYNDNACVTPPVVTCKNLALDFTLGGSVTLTTQDLLVRVTDNCSAIKSLSLNRTTPFTSGDVGVKTVVLTATDEKGNKGTCTSTISVTRSELPHVTCPESKIINLENLGTDGSIPITTATTNMPATSMTFTDKLLDMPCGTVSPPAGFPYDATFNAAMAANADRIVGRTFSATFVGFSSTCSQVFYIVKPNINTIQSPTPATAICQGGSPNTNPNNTGFPRFSNGNPVSDITKGLTASYTDAPIVGSLLIRNWLVKDKCGVSRTFTQNITIPTCLVPQIAISGAIKRETGENIAATVKIYNTRDSINKAEGSFYNFPSVPVGESYRIKPERNTDVLNGVTTFDIAMISKYILGLEPVKSPYQLIAMDVNRSGDVDAADMLAIRNLILRKSTTFVNNSAWRFIPKNYVFKNPTNPFAEDFPEVLSINNPNQSINDADFVAVKIGDANLTARTDLNAIQVRNAPEIDYLEVQDMVLEAGKEYKIPVKTKIKSLIALQFALNIDKNAVENFTLENGDLTQFGEGNYNVLAEKSIVTTAWASAKATSDNTIFTLVVKVKKQVTVKDLVSLNTGFSDNLAYDTEGGEKQLHIHFTGEKSEKPVFELQQNRPNPFSGETIISFILPETNNAELSIFDITGKKIYTLNRSFSKGYNEVILNKSILQNTGVYFYRLQSDKYSEVKRMQYFAD